MATLSKFSLDEPAFSHFAFYTTVVLAKQLLVGLQVTYRRISGNVYANPEDVATFHKGPDKKVVLTDSTVERLRRNNLNDIENIVPWALLGFLYVATEPDVNTALWHFRVFAGSRIVHTMAYQLILPLPQPTRFLAHMVGVGVMGSMAYRIIRSAQY